MASHVLVICTGNICRSPMVEAMLRHHLAAAGVSDVAVESAGTIGWSSGPMSEETAEVLRERGVAVHDHVSRRLTAEMLDAADLVIGMTREHLWAVTARQPSAGSRSFVLGEIVRLGEKAGPARELPVAEWVAEVDALRGGPDARALARASDEVADPLGEPLDTYRELGVRADDLTLRLTALLAGSCSPRS